MRQILLGMVILSVSCSDDSAVKPSHQDGDGGSAGEVSAPTACERAARLGDFTAHFEKISGDCGTPADERALVHDLDSVVPCMRLEPDVWSADNCTRRQRLSCGAISFDTELTLRPDGNLDGTETRSITDCSATYAVTYTRR